MSHNHIDARNLICPMPVLRVQQRVAGLFKGDTLEVVCTDPGVLHDIPAWCRVNGHRVTKTDEKNNEITITLEVGDK